MQGKDKGWREELGLEMESTAAADLSVQHGVSEAHFRKVPAPRVSSYGLVYGQVKSTH
jgi:hypothetical protein